jgi:hypothetical protein
MRRLRHFLSPGYHRRLYGFYASWKCSEQHGYSPLSHNQKLSERRPKTLPARFGSLSIVLEPREKEAPGTHQAKDDVLNLRQGTHQKCRGK